MSFLEWLKAPDTSIPQWKERLENCDASLFVDLGLSKEEIEGILEKLNDYEVL